MNTKITICGIVVATATISVGVFLTSDAGDETPDFKWVTQDNLDLYQAKLIRDSDDHYLKDEETKRSIEILLSRRVSEKLSKEIADAIITSHRENDLDPWMLLAFIRVENSYLDPTLINSYGAVGLMQVVKRIHWGEYPECGTESLMEVYTNICYGSKIYLEKLRFANGNEKLAKWLYNGCNLRRRRNGSTCVSYPDIISTHQVKYSNAEIEDITVMF